MQNTIVLSNPDEKPELLTLFEVSKLLRISPLTVKRWEKRLKNPLIPLRINSRGDRRYKRSDINAILESNKPGHE